MAMDTEQGGMTGGTGSGTLLQIAVDLYNLLQKKDSTMGDLLQLMEPIPGQQQMVEKVSDQVVAVQTQIDERLRALIKAIRQGGERAVAPADDSSWRADARSTNDEVEELKASLASVTQREKERVEGLQAQIEMLGQELRDCRYQRTKEKASIVTAESQTSRAKASLTCAEGDLGTLRITLDQELSRSHKLQARISQLEGQVGMFKAEVERERKEKRELEMRIEKEIAKGMERASAHQQRYQHKSAASAHDAFVEDDARTRAEVRVQVQQVSRHQDAHVRSENRVIRQEADDNEDEDVLHDDSEIQEGDEAADNSYEAYLSDRHERLAAHHMADGWQGQHDHDAAVARDHSVHTTIRVTTMSSNTSSNAHAPSPPYSIDWSNSSRPASLSSSLIPSNSDQQHQHQSAAPQPSRSRPSSSKSASSQRNHSNHHSNTVTSQSHVPNRPASPSHNPSSVPPDSRVSAYPQPFFIPRKMREDTTSLTFLRSRVMSGVVNKTTPLQLAIEFCGKSSFSLRHDEEKYQIRAEQLVAAAYQALRDRWLTVLKNSENVEGKGMVKQPRLGSFEVELLWLDANKEPRRTMLHSKLKTRVFPKLRLIDTLKEVLDPSSQEAQLQQGDVDVSWSPPV